MAKQTGLYHIRGKVGDYKYYGMKGVDGTIMAKQNEGMSERVKTDAAYDNTRRNNYEFGMATSTAGAITRALSQKWRYLLVPFATAKIAKDILAVGKSDGMGSWGNRTMNSGMVARYLPPVLQKHVKNKISDFSPINFAFVEEDDTTGISVSANDLTNDKAQAAGCDGVRVVVVINDIVPADGGYDEKSITPAICTQKVLGTSDVDFGGDLSISSPFDQPKGSGFFTVVLLPYRTIGSEKFIMQEYSSALFPELE